MPRSDHSIVAADVRWSALSVAVELGQLRERGLGRGDSAGAVFLGVRRELTVERVLFGGREVLLDGGERRVGAHPLGGEGLGPAVEVGIRSEKRGRAQRERGEQAG